MGGLHHVEVNVSDLERSIDFWGWLLPELGYELYQQWPEGRSWRRGQTYVVFVQADERYRNYGLHRKRPGLNHLAFWAESTAQVEALPDQLRARGVKVLYADRAAEAIGAPSSTSLFVEDPDRIKVEVISPETDRDGSDGQTHTERG
jgi:catechol 2,3-dioxygenase-like lactoylglutathione lyase family enzyme